MDPITGAVVIAGLKYVGQPSAEVIRHFLSRVLTPTGDALGQALAHPIVEWHGRRVERGQELLASAAAVVAHSGAEPQSVPGRVLMPLLEKGSLEEDPDLSKRWIALLANAATKPDAVLPAFVGILGELSPIEAKLLQRLYVVSLECHRTLKCGH